MLHVRLSEPVTVQPAHERSWPQSNELSAQFSVQREGLPAIHTHLRYTLCEHRKVHPCTSPGHTAIPLQRFTANDPTGDHVSSCRLCPHVLWTVTLPSARRLPLVCPAAHWPSCTYSCPYAQVAVVQGTWKACGRDLPRLNTWTSLIESVARGFRVHRSQ